MRPPPEVKTAEQAHAFLRDLQGQIADAQNVVIVGSGPGALFLPSGSMSVAQQRRCSWHRVRRRNCDSLRPGQEEDHPRQLRPVPLPRPEVEAFSRSEARAAALWAQSRRRLQRQGQPRGAERGQGAGGHEGHVVAPRLLRDDARRCERSSSSLFHILSSVDDMTACSRLCHPRDRQQAQQRALRPSAPRQLRAPQNDSLSHTLLPPVRLRYR